MLGPELQFWNILGLQGRRQNTNSEEQDARFCRRETIFWNFLQIKLSQKRFPWKVSKMRKKTVPHLNTNVYGGQIWQEIWGDICVLHLKYSCQWYEWFTNILRGFVRSRWITSLAVFHKEKNHIQRDRSWWRVSIHYFWLNVHIIERKLLFYRSINVFQIFSDFHETSNDIFQSQGKDGKEKRNFDRSLEIDENKRECKLQLRAGN